MFVEMVPVCAVAAYLVMRGAVGGQSASEERHRRPPQDLLTE